jgi:ATP-dependent NAD(P)H-hydrate dehydratase
MFRQLLARAAPSMTESSYKGAQGGRVCVLGGCANYTGAPYFAAFAGY